VMEMPPGFTLGMALCSAILCSFYSGALSCSTSYCVAKTQSVGAENGTPRLRAWMKVRSSYWVTSVLTLSIHYRSHSNLKVSLRDSEW
jgi:hypothetical protein